VALYIHFPIHLHGMVLNKLSTGALPLLHALTNSRKKKHVLLRAVFTLGSASRQLRRRRSSVRSFSQQDASDRLARTFPAAQFVCSRGTFRKRYQVTEVLNMWKVSMGGSLTALRRTQV
jgi:hypothetical protein